MKLKKIKYFTKTELAIWIGSIILIVSAFFIFDGKKYLNMIASLVGTTALIFCAKGNPLGQAFMIIFASLYAYISLSFKYYGEMITYLGMSLPMSIVAFISWLKNPSKESKAEVKVNTLSKKEMLFGFIVALVVTVIFYFIMRELGTSNLVISTVSITTSFFAAYLTFRRCEYFALAYALNDIVLIIMWIMATIKNISYISVIICFLVFLVNDTYSYLNWKKMKERQRDAE
ncbi:MAG: nicotinamide mononucleotide transporter [Clostridiales bacterium]|nr:nicotinamide mononucleotide transporter [Clostridiales bacterium]